MKWIGLGYKVAPAAFFCFSDVLSSAQTTNKCRFARIIGLFLAMSPQKMHS